MHTIAQLEHMNGMSQHVLGARGEAGIPGPAGATGGLGVAVTDAPLISPSFPNGAQCDRTEEEARAQHPSMLDVIKRAAEGEKK